MFSNRLTRLSQQHAMIAAESLGFETCMLAAVHLLIQNGIKPDYFGKSMVLSVLLGKV